MSKENDGGKAFPQSGVYHPDPVGAYFDAGGMTLRDYFAAKALCGLLADPECNGSCSNTAKVAYTMADAMLEARNK